PPGASAPQSLSVLLIYVEHKPGGLAGNKSPAVSAARLLCSEMLTEMPGGQPFLFRAGCLIVSDRGAHERPQRRLIKPGVLGEVNGASRFGVKARIEQVFGVVERRAFEEVYFHVGFERSNRADQAIASPHGCAPFHLLGDV